MRPGSIDEYCVGYDIDKSDSSEYCYGHAEIDGNQYAVSLSLNPTVHAIDVGRNQDGEVVWVSPALLIACVTSVTEHSIDDLLPPVSYTPHLFSGNQIDLETSSRRSELGQKSFYALLKRRKAWIIGASVMVGAVVLLLMIPGRPDELVPVTQSEAVEIFPGSTDPVQAAKDFVLNGDVDLGLLPEEIHEDELSATVVSTNGELVLVEMSVRASEGNNKFATLLLQKTEATWRIREVFDPQQN